ncbi:hypothetical protein ACC741_37875, partial [Rhizobium johnstonii]|uniref:hypothetical protein n=1 Tax=Rhizobium johnstonii TaxID=3019933 RepID=UPI003F9E448C
GPQTYIRTLLGSIGENTDFSRVSLFYSFSSGVASISLSQMHDLKNIAPADRGVSHLDYFGDENGYLHYLPEDYSLA